MHVEPWRVVDEVTVRFVPDGRVISFSAVNGGARPRDPRELFMQVDYVNGGASPYVFSCAGVDGGGKPRTLVAPGGEVRLRCEDTIMLNGKPSRLPPERLTVVTEP